MPELLVKVQDPSPAPPDPFFGRGYVLGIHPDGWGWGTEELADPRWRIIKVPDLLPAHARVLTTGQTLPVGTPRTTLRLAKLNLSHAALASQQTFLNTHVVDVLVDVPSARRDVTVGAVDAARQANRKNAYTVSNENRVLYQRDAMPTSVTDRLASLPQLERVGPRLRRHVVDTWSNSLIELVMESAV